MASPGQRKVLFVGWDAADWNILHSLMDQGLLPTFSSLVSRGVMADLQSMDPMLSPMLWTSITTGHVPDRHGVFGFIEPGPEGKGVQPVGSYRRKVKAVWDILSGEGYRCHQIGFWATHPAEAINGISISNQITHPISAAGGRVHLPGTISPEQYYEDLNPLFVRKREIGAAEILAFAPKAKALGAEEDPRLPILAENIAEAATIQAAATWALEKEPWDFAAVYFESLDQFCHEFMIFHGDQRHPDLAERDHEIFSDLIHAAYRFHDLMLARLLEIAGKDTTVVLCSDHGFLNWKEMNPILDPRHAGISSWHRREGVFVMAGPGVRKDEHISPVHLLDVCPTLLHAFGLPVGQDMPGRVVPAVFETPEKETRIPSWEDRDPRRVVDESHFQTAFQSTTGAGGAGALTKHFEALGYIEASAGQAPEAIAEQAGLELIYNHARSLQATGYGPRALPLFERLVRERPYDSHFLFDWVRCLLACGYLEQARRVIETSFRDEVVFPPMAAYLAGRIHLNLGNRDQARLYFQDALEADPHNLEFHLQLGVCYTRLKDWSNAETCFDRAIEINPRFAPAHLARAHLYLKMHENAKAADSGFVAVDLKPNYGQAHYLVGIALSRMGWYERAIQAFEFAILHEPALKRAYHWLATLQRNVGNDPQKAKRYQEMWKAASAEMEVQNRLLDENWAKTTPLPEIPDSGTRRRLEQEEIAKFRRPEPGTSGKSFILVSGLPRSGTSLLMQMLEAGGLPIQTDGIRQADPNNPLGFFEWEPIKRVPQEPELLDEPGLEGKGIKIISALLPHLPPPHRYRVLFMMRPIAEVAQSQIRMLERGGESPEIEREALERQLLAHRHSCLQYIDRAPNFEVLRVPFRRLFEDAPQVVGEIEKFIGSEQLPLAERMLSVIDSRLYREKQDFE